jgi:hypothetical protein
LLSSRQGNVPELAFEPTPMSCALPPNIYLGEVAGVGRTSQGRIFVYTRTGHPYATLGDNRTFYRGGSRLFEFDASGKFVRELGQDVYGFNTAFGLRVDPQDNVWTIDQSASQVVKFDKEGRLLLVLGRKPEAINVRPAGPGGGAPAGEEGGGGGRGGGGRAGERPRLRRDQAFLDRRSASRLTWRGTAPATSTLPTASAPPTGSPSSIRTASSSGSGARLDPVQGSSTASRRWPSTRRATSTPPTLATSGSRCSTATACSSRSSPASACRRRCV